MTTAAYEVVLNLARQLTPEEQSQLVHALEGGTDAMAEGTDSLPLGEASAEIESASPEGLGARFVAYLKTVPSDAFDRADRDMMKQAIEEGCERVDSDGW